MQWKRSGSQRMNSRKETYVYYYTNSCNCWLQTNIRMLLPVEVIGALYHPGTSFMLFTTIIDLEPVRRASLPLGVD